MLIMLLILVILIQKIFWIKGYWHTKMRHCLPVWFVHVCVCVFSLLRFWPFFIYLFEVQRPWTVHSVLFTLTFVWTVIQKLFFYYFQFSVFNFQQNKWYPNAHRVLFYLLLYSCNYKFEHFERIYIFGKGHFDLNQ